MKIPASGHPYVLRINNGFLAALHAFLDESWGIAPHAPVRVYLRGCHLHWHKGRYCGVQGTTTGPLPGRAATKPSGLFRNHLHPGSLDRHRFLNAHSGRPRVDAGVGASRPLLVRRGRSAAPSLVPSAHRSAAPMQARPCPAPTPESFRSVRGLFSTTARYC